MSQKSLCTRTSLVNDFHKLGVKPGSTLLVHSSLSSLGFVVGGAETVVSALLDVLGATGTLVVPTHSSDNSDPSEWSCPTAPEAWWATIRDEMPVYDPIKTRTRSVGVIPETVRTWPGAVRSDHPQTSFAALGVHARQVTENHALDSALGERSPLARLEELNADILLLGVGYEACTAFHLAEYRVSRPLVNNSFAIITESGRVWMTVRDCQLDSSCFEQLGSDLEHTVPQSVVQGRVGDAWCRIVVLKAAVYFATHWLKKKANVSIT